MSRMAVTMVTIKTLLFLACLESGLASQMDDPCMYHVCSAGEVCKVVYNHLLQVPVAACHEVGANHSSGPCITYTVGANIMNCKTESNWRNVCQFQCSLRGLPLLSNMLVSYACFSYSGSEATFLQADCACCPQVPITLPPNTQVTQEITTTSDVTTALKDTKANAGDQGSRLLYPLLVGPVTMVMVACFLVGMAVLVRCRRRYRRLPPKTVTMVTSYENRGALVTASPMIEKKRMVGGGGSYTRLVDDEQQPNSAPSPAPRRGYQKLVESYSSPDQ